MVPLACFNLKNPTEIDHAFKDFISLGDEIVVDFNRLRSSMALLSKTLISNGIRRSQYQTQQSSANHTIPTGHGGPPGPKKLDPNNPVATMKIPKTVIIANMVR